MRKVSEIGLKAEYENNEDARTLIHCLPALAFVPPQDVLKAFDLLADSMPQGIDCMDEVVTYFEHTYIRGLLYSLVLCLSTSHEFMKRYLCKILRNFAGLITENVSEYILCY